MSKIKGSLKYIKLQLCNELLECYLYMLSAGKWRTVMYHHSNSHLVHSAFIKARNHINQTSLKIYQVCLKSKNALGVTSCKSNWGEGDGVMNFQVCYHEIKSTENINWCPEFLTQKRFFSMFMQPSFTQSPPS